MQRLSVGIDVSPLALTRAGTARHIRSLLAALEGEDIELRRYAFGGASRALVPVRDVGWYLGALPRRARRDGVDVLHCPTQRAPVCSQVPLVVTVHDLAVLRHPRTFNRWTRTYSRLALPRVARAARRLIAVSEFTRRELLELLDMPEEKVRVIPNAVGDPFRPRGDATRGDYVLAVSTLEPRKNLPRLIEAFRRARLNGLRLLVAGGPGWGGVRVEGDGVRWLGEVGDDELARLYRGARCVAYVSLYEGFGLPVLEAMACGTAVVSSDLPPVREFGRGVIRVDPRDPDAIAAGLAEATARREELGREGQAAAASYDWPRVASQ